MLYNSVCIYKAPVSPTWK